MSATSPPLSGNLEGKKDADDRKKSRCPSPTPLDGPSSREDDENPHFKRSDGKTKFDIEHLKKIQISCSFKRRQPLASGGGGNTFDPSLITPVRRPGEGKVPIFSRLTVINQRDENDYLEQRKPKPEQRNESKPSSSGTQSTRPRSLSRSRRSAKWLPDPYRNRDEFIRLKKEHMRRLRQEKRIRKSGHSRHSRSKSPSSSDSDSSTGSERSRSSRSRSRERRSSEGRSRTRSKSRDRRRRDRSRDRSRDNRRSDETNPREMVPYPMGPGHWIGPRPYPPPYAMLPGPIYPYPPFRPHIPPYLRPHRLMNWRP